MGRPLRWGLIGCGDIVRKRVAGALKRPPEHELVVVCRGAAAELSECVAATGAARGCQDWGELVRDPEVEAVYIATPVDQHAEQTIAAAEAGKHVLCEKPMALDAPSCDRMIEACRANGVRLGVAYYRRLFPIVKRIREILASGEIGRPVLAQTMTFERFDRRPDEPRGWLLDKSRAGGGPMMDFGSHRLELLWSLLGPVREARGALTTAFYEREVEDTAIATLAFSSGALGMVVVSHAAAEPRDTLEILGGEGALRSARLNDGELEVASVQGERTERLKPPANLHQPLVDDFAQAVADGRPPAVNGEAGRDVQRLLDAIYS